MVVGLVHDLQEPILYVMSVIGSTFFLKFDFCNRMMDEPAALYRRLIFFSY